MAANGRACKTPGCGRALSKAKGLYCSEDCYLRGCREVGQPPRTCNQEGCSNISVPGEQGGARCARCYAEHKMGVRQQLVQRGRICGLEGCGKIVYGDKPKYGQFCSLDCGRLSGKGRPCVECGLLDVFTGSQSGKLCLDCYNSLQNAAKVAERAMKERSRGRGEGGGKRRKVAAGAVGE